jgi:hypothetical protein
MIGGPVAQSNLVTIKIFDFLQQLIVIWILGHDILSKIHTIDMGQQMNTLSGQWHDLVIPASSVHMPIELQI